MPTGKDGADEGTCGRAGSVVHRSISLTNEFSVPVHLLAAVVDDPQEPSHLDETAAGPGLSPAFEVYMYVHGWMDGWMDAHIHMHRSQASRQM